MAESLIDIVGVHKSFGPQEVLRGIDLSITPGESIVIIGQSGCGKSVLLKHLIRLIEPDEGTVRFDGQDIAGFKGRELAEFRRRFGMLFQSAALFDSMTVEENVGIGLVEAHRHTHEEVAQIVEQCLEVVGLSQARQ